MGGFMLSSFIGGLLGDWFDRKLGPKGRVLLMQLYLLAFGGMSYLTLQIDWGRSVLVYIVIFMLGLVGSIGFSGVILPMVASVVAPKLSATAFGLLFSLVQGGISALMSLGVGFLAQKIGLAAVMFWVVTVPYLANAIFWFLFYKYYPKDVAALKAKLAAETA
jgi:MFS family permease